MSDQISEQDYPIHDLWIFKPILGQILGGIIFTIFVLGNHTNSPDQVSSTNNTGASIFIYALIVIVFVTVGTTVRMLQRANYHYLLEDHYLTLKQGIIKKQQRHIPYGVIQNLFIKQDLLDRMFGLGALSIENASQGGDSKLMARNQKNDPLGFSGNSVKIPGLLKQNAEALKQDILQRMKDNPITDTGSGL